jgi:O-antigen ligase
MKEIFFIKDTLANKISYYHMLAFLCTLPLDMFYSELILCSLLLHTFIHLSRKKILTIRIEIMLPALLYALTIAGIIYSTDPDQGFKDWEKQLGLLLFPLIFSLTPIDFKKYKIPLLKCFSIACIAGIVYLYFDATRTILYFHLPGTTLFSNSFTNQNFSSPLNLHATYFSMYCGISLVTLMYLLLNIKGKTGRIFYFMGCFVLLTGIIQLSSKSVLFAVLLIINLMLPYFLLKEGQRKKFMLISSLLSLIVICAFTKIGSFKNRFVDSLKQDLMINKSFIQNGAESRATRWKIAFALIGKAPVLGNGSGSEVKLLHQKYFEQHLYNSYLHQLNAHNEYISMMLKFGIIGIVLYAFVLFRGYKEAFRNKDIFFCSFLILVTLVSLSENILDVNKGIFFFGFFFPFLSITGISKNDKFRNSPGNSLSHRSVQNYLPVNA